MTRPRKILIADDSASIRNSMEQMLTELSEEKYEIIFATNGLEECNIAFHERPDLIITDIEMPIMDGIRAIKKIKSNNLINAIPIIVMSSTRLFPEAIEAGANDFLIKPFNQYEVLLRVKQVLKLAEEEEKVKRQTETMRKQNQELVFQRDTISRQKKELLDDLAYARIMQKSILPSKQAIDELFPDHFIYDLPKNIVSGDFYWIAQKDEKIIFALGDCTGHGMSGALMTMVGATFLNEIVSKYNLCSDVILSELRARVIHLLNQRGIIGEVSNGMDITLCIYDRKQNTIQFSGANNPVYIVRKSALLEIINGDRMPVGFFFDYEQPFSTTDIKVHKGDCVFLFSDGYADQFGGPDGKKFRYRKYQELITEVAFINGAEMQLQRVQSTMESWIDGYEQVDDMMIWGIRL